MVAGTKGSVGASGGVTDDCATRVNKRHSFQFESGFCTILCKSESEPCACASATKSTGGGLAVRVDIWTLERASAGALADPWMCLRSVVNCAMKSRGLAWRGECLSALACREYVSDL